jgi:hypothetical protein
VTMEHFKAGSSSCPELDRTRKHGHVNSISH